MNRPTVSQTTLRPAPADPPAPCRLAGRLAAILIGGSLLALAAICTDLLLRAPDQDAPASQWMRRFNLSAPALWPAGSAMRHPESMHPGVDLRFGPGLGDAP